MANILVPAKGATLDPLPSLYGAPAYTNLVLHNTAADNAAWAKQACTISANAVVAPDGTITADKLVETATTNKHTIYQAVTLTAATYTTSVFAKKAERDIVKVECVTGGNGGVWFNLTTGAVGTADAGFTGEIESVGNGWYRCYVSCVATAASYYPAFAVCDADGNNSHAGDITKGAYVWGLQCTLGSIAACRGSAPIVTAASTVTTTAISMSYDIANHSDEKGAYYCEAVSYNITGAEQYLVSVGASGRLLTQAIANNRLYDGTNIVDCAGVTLGVLSKYGNAYSASEGKMTSFLDSTTPVEGNYDGVFNNAWGDIRIAVAGAGIPTYVTLTSNIRRYNLSYTAALAKLVELTT